MVRTQTHIRSDASGLGQRRDMGTAVAVRRRVPSWTFWRHFLEMFAAMWVGMVAGVAVYLAVTGFPSYRQALLHQPVEALLVMAVSMTLPMAGWMLFRGHGWRNTAEMSGAMLVPAVPFVFLAGLHVTRGVSSCVYMMLSVLAMLGLMFYRRDVYSMPMRGLWRRRLRH
jgi:hypothetical protein